MSSKICYRMHFFGCQTVVYLLKDSIEYFYIGHFIVFGVDKMLKVSTYGNIYSCTTVKSIQLIIPNWVKIINYNFCSLITCISPLLSALVPKHKAGKRVLQGLGYCMILPFCCTCTAKQNSGSLNKEKSLKTNFIAHYNKYNMYE